MTVCFTCVLVQGKVELQGRLDTGLMATTLSQTLCCVWGKVSLQPLLILSCFAVGVSNFNVNNSNFVIYPCVALEDFDHDLVLQHVARVSADSSHRSLSIKSDSGSGVGNVDCLLLSLGTIPIDSCQVSSYWKDKLVGLIKEYESVFSCHHLDCGDAFCHRIRLTDDRPLRLP